MRKTYHKLLSDVETYDYTKDRYLTLEKELVSIDKLLFNEILKRLESKAREEEDSEYFQEVKSPESYKSEVSDVWVHKEFKKFVLENMELLKKLQVYEIFLEVEKRLMYLAYMSEQL